MTRFRVSVVFMVFFLCSCTASLGVVAAMTRGGFATDPMECHPCLGSVAVADNT